MIFLVQPLHCELQPLNFNHPNLFSFVILRPQLGKPLLGPEAFIGKTGRAITELRPEGTVLIDGEYWTAVSREPVSEGEEVGVIEVKGLKLTVKRLNQEDHIR